MAFVVTVTATEAELLPAGIAAGEMLHVLSAGAPLQARFTWFGNGPPGEVKVNWYVAVEPETTEALPLPTFVPSLKESKAILVSRGINKGTR